MTRRKRTPEELFEVYKDAFYRKIERSEKIVGKTTRIDPKVPTSTALVDNFKRKSVADQKRIERQQEIEELHQLIHSFILPAIKLTRRSLSKFIFNKICRIIGTLIFELTVIDTGWISEECLRKMSENKEFKPTLDHIYPRQFAGYVILHHIIMTGDLSYQDFKNYVSVFCQIAKVTGPENTRVGKRDGLQSTSKYVCPEYTYEKGNIPYKTFGRPIKRLETVAPTEVQKVIFGKRYGMVCEYLKLINTNTRPVDNIVSMCIVNESGRLGESKGVL